MNATRAKLLIAGTAVAVGGLLAAAYLFTGGRQELMSARTQMMRAEPGASWVDGEIQQHAKGSDQLTAFEAGAKAVASSSVAAVFVPCTSTGKIPGGQYNLSVVVQLKHAGDSGTSETSADLINLATSAASYAHTEAKCDMPSKLEE